MLFLSRKVNETIVINDDIRVTVFEIRKGRVRLGIEAPGEIPIRRSELDLSCQENTEFAYDDDEDECLDEDPPSCAMFNWLDACFDEIQKKD